MEQLPLFLCHAVKRRFSPRRDGIDLPPVNLFASDEAVGLQALQDRVNGSRARRPASRRPLLDSLDDIVAIGGALPDDLQHNEL